jgi:hypothetical protein
MKITNASRHSENMSSTMGAFSLAIAGCVCLGLAAYRMRWGDDHGNVHVKSGKKMTGGRTRMHDLPRALVG